MLSQLNAIHTLTVYVHKTHLIFIVPSTFSLPNGPYTLFISYRFLHSFCAIGNNYETPCKV